MIFWNIGRYRNKDDGFWTVLGGGGVIMLSETWAEEKEWEPVKRRFPKGF